MIRHLDQNYDIEQIKGLQLCEWRMGYRKQMGIDQNA